jgi:hypothetical protein
MHPVVRDEVYRMGYEAIRNACTHSGGSRLEVALHYAHDVTLRGMLWGHHHTFGAGFHGGFGGTRFPGMEPLGDYPIHIIVKGGRVTLLGVVDNESDKTVAGMKARQVPGSFAVENELMVESSSQSTKH